MTNFAKTLVIAAALFAGANSITAAYAASNGLQAACQSGSFTPRGVWDCR